MVGRVFLSLRRPRLKFSHHSPRISPQGSVGTLVSIAFNIKFLLPNRLTAICGLEFLVGFIYLGSLAKSGSGGVFGFFDFIGPMAMERCRVLWGGGACFM